jgi:hypothetical protein
MRNNSEEWTFGVKELEKGELWSGYVKNVVDGDTVDVRFNIYGIQRVRLVGINTPEIGEEGYEEAVKAVEVAKAIPVKRSIKAIANNSPWFLVILNEIFTLFVKKTHFT